MDVNKTLVLIAIFGFAASAAALSFNVQVKEKTEFNEYQIKYNNTSTLDQTIEMAVENPGSLGCSYRVKTSYEYGNTAKTRFSNSYPVWPGDVKDAKIRFIPYDYNGTVKVSVSSFFCDRQEHLVNFTYNQTESVKTSNEIESRTIKAGERRAKIYVPQLENATLIPVKTPVYWKTGSVKLRENYASIKYEPPIFREGESIDYVAVRNDTIIGKTKVVLEDEETRYQEIERRFKYFFSNII